MERTEIPVTVGYETVDLGLGLKGGKGNAIVAPVVKTVSSHVFGESLNGLIQNVSHVLDNCDTKSSSFEIDEVELSLTVNADGEVSILSVADIKAGTEAAVTVKLKKKNDKS